jgi:hypothetical protein
MEPMPPPPATHLRRMLAVSAAIGTLALPNLACDSSAAEDTRPAGIAGCKPYFNIHKYPDHEYEACTAYVVNSSEVALQGMYKFGNNSVSLITDGARHHFRTRFMGSPRQSVEKKVESWPQTNSLTGNRVHDSIRIRSVSSSLKQDRAIIKTRENWKVTNPGGNTLLKESGDKNITMCRGRLPGHPLHSWFVVKFAREPRFDCVEFDREHQIAP